MDAQVMVDRIRIVLHHMERRHQLFGAHFAGIERGKQVLRYFLAIADLLVERLVVIEPDTGARGLTRCAMPRSRVGMPFCRSVLQTGKRSGLCRQRIGECVEYSHTPFPPSFGFSLSRCCANRANISL